MMMYHIINNIIARAPKSVICPQIPLSPSPLTNVTDYVCDGQQLQQPNNIIERSCRSL